MSKKKRSHNSEDDVSIETKKRKILEDIEFENEETEQVTEQTNQNQKKKIKFTQTEIQQLKETEILFKSSFFRLAVKKYSNSKNPSLQKF
jgi:CRISPR/Cas system CMR subunit Cmr4 (Cas7 group RAMP superfamily)